MQRRSVSFLLLLWLILTNASAYAGKVPAEQMKNLLNTWPPPGWQLTPPGSDTPYPPYIAAGEFSSTLYRQIEDKLWSAHISVTDQQTNQQSIRRLDNFPFCDVISYKKYPARHCGTMGEHFGRRGLAYAVDRYLVEISIIGPHPLELPEFQLKLPKNHYR